MKSSNGLPRGWVKAPVRDLVNLINGYAFKPSDWEDTGLPIIRIQNLNNPKAEFNYCKSQLPEKFLVDTGNLLFAWSGTPGTSFGAHIWRGGTAWLNQHIFKVVFNEECLNKSFLRLAINQNLQEYIRAAHGGAGLAHITKGKFDSSEVLLPPFAEQSRIVTKIEELFTKLDAGVASLKAAKVQLKRYRQAVLKAAVEGELTREWREQHQHELEPAAVLLARILRARRAKWEADQLAKMQAQGKPPKDDKWKAKYQEPAAPDTNQLPSLPDRWQWVSWNQIGFSQNGRAFPSEYYQATGVKLLRPGNLHANGKLVWTDENTRRMPEKWRNDYPEFVVGARELVINLTAQSLKDEFLGRVCLTGADEYCLLNQRLARLTPIGVLPEYLLWMFKSEVFRKFVNGLNSGSLIQHMFTSQMADFILPLPPIREQEQIVAEVERRLSIADEIEATLNAELKRAERLRQAILKRAFEGKLAPQDPHDEPAAVLLERIKAEKAQQTTPDRRSKRKREKFGVPPSGGQTCEKDQTA